MKAKLTGVILEQEQLARFEEGVSPAMTYDDLLFLLCLTNFYFLEGRTRSCTSQNLEHLLGKTPFEQLSLLQEVVF
ncbi:hypothetical protein PIB30_009163 [Stylosanthes scabra]|uniref:Uncharacterized protein n=1 Tax=Stylosanthes scabra TaxID=79078 RepID=A0ABU6Y569_9FABA|nr:hypothetical protein [Stylosanthes scabra]